MEDLNSSGELVSNEEKSSIQAADITHSDGPVIHSMVNGLSNGYDKEKTEKERKEKSDKEHSKEKPRDKDYDKHRSDKDRHKDKHKDGKDRDREKERHKDKEKSKEHDKAKHSSSSSSKDKHSSSSSKDKDREREKDKERKDKEKSKHHDDKDRKDKEHKSSSSSSKDKEHKSSSSSKHNSSSSSKDKEKRDKDHRPKEKEGDRKDKESEQKDKEGERKDKEKVKDREHKEKDKRDKEKDHSRDKEKDKERSKDKHSPSKDKDRHSSDKHKSDKEKHSSSSSHKDKERHKEKPREGEKSKEKEKERVKEKVDTTVEKEVKFEKEEIPLISPKKEFLEIKEERDEDYSFQNSTKEDSMDDDDDGKLMIKEEPTDDESKLDNTESSVNMSFVKREEEEEDDDDMPMAARMEKIKRELESDSEDDVPLSARKKPKKENVKKRKKVDSDYEEEDDDFKPAKKKKVKKETKETKKKAVKVKEEVTESPKKGRKKKEEEEQEVWKWWEEEKKPDGVKWNFLEHKGPVFAPPYEPLPSNVKFYYNDKEVKLSEKAEEVATFYARMLDHDYTTKPAFNTNFMNDWRKMMTEKERDLITDLKKCNFKHIHAYFIKKSEERKAMSKEEKKAIKEENEKLTKEYGFCTIDGHKEKIGNFKIEPPGLFRGRGDHPKMGKLKLRITAEDIIINCSKGSKVPPPPEGHRWKEVRHDNSVTWLASWIENVQGQVKYIMLNPSSKLKGEKDWQKYEMARKLAKSIDKIRDDYQADFKSKEMRIRQRAVAMYFIDKLALRAGNEKDEDQADTVGCCSLRVEHIQLHEKKDGKENVVVFDFLGKDSIRYYNEVPVEKRVFKNLKLFVEDKKGDDDLFDRLNTAVLNKHLSDLMEGLTAKVFRTYNASWTLQAQLKELTDPDSSVAEKLLSYNRANRAVAILCNHQRAVPKTHDKSMANLREKLANKRAAVEEAKKNYKHAERDAKHGSASEKIKAQKAKKTLERLKEQLLKLELQETDREENKCIALGTSKLNYLDPRISVAWCKKFDVPIDKVYNKTQRDKFRWAIDMATADYVF